MSLSISMAVSGFQMFGHLARKEALHVGTEDDSNVDDSNADDSYLARLRQIVADSR